MKSNHNTRSSRRSVKNIQIIQGGQDLTAQAGLIPVVKFLKKHGFASKIEQTLDHQRGATGVYDAVDMILLPLVAIVGGARSISSIVTVWNDRILCLAAGLLRRALLIEGREAPFCVERAELGLLLCFAKKCCGFKGKNSFI